MNGAAMLALQQLDTAIDQLTTRRTRVPEVGELAAATAARDAWHGDLQAARHQQALAEEAIATAEREGVALTERQARLERQLKTVIAPREAEALMHEIEVVRAEHDELDDRELAAMEEHGAETDRIAELEGRGPIVQAEVDRATDSYDAAVATLDHERIQLVERRDAARRETPEPDVLEYDRRRARLDGVAVAALVGRRCDGCHLDLSPAEVDGVGRLPEGQLPECPHCGRLLVR